MGLVSRMPAVCSALRARSFAELGALELIETTGPRQSSTTTFRFRLDRAGAPVRQTNYGVVSARRPTSQQRPASPAGLQYSDRTLFLVACVKTKAPTVQKARDLYRSSLFDGARRLVEATGCRWFILSAKYGLVEPDQRIEPYEQTLKGAPVAERRAWASKVREQMAQLLPPTDHVVVLAGREYREFLMEEFRRCATRVDVPMAGLTMGRQIQWLQQAAKHVALS